MSHNWGNNIITIQGTNTIITIPVTKKLGAQTKQPKILICYDFHFGISDEVGDLMFATKSKLFSIGTVGIPKLAKLKQPISPFSSTGLGIIEQIPNVPIEPIFVLPIQIFIPHDTFKQHVLETFFQHKIGEIIINETSACE